MSPGILGQVKKGCGEPLCLGHSGDATTAPASAVTVAMDLDAT